MIRASWIQRRVCASRDRVTSPCEIRNSDVCHAWKEKIQLFRLWKVKNNSEIVNWFFLSRVFAWLPKKNGKSLCIACHLYARTMLIFSVLLKLTDVLPRTIARQNQFSAIHTQLCEKSQEVSRLWVQQDEEREKCTTQIFFSLKHRKLTKTATGFP